MYTSVRYPDTIEPLVQFIEETEPEDILEKTAEKLRADVSIKEMCTASALAVIRSSEMPTDHHGGPLHPIAGLYAVGQTASRMSGETSFLPVMQNVALANTHIHHPTMGPYVLPEFEPLNAGGLEETKQAFLQEARRGEINAADHHFLWLAENLPREAALDLLLTVAIPCNVIDDHKFIYPFYTWKFLEWIDWEHFQVLNRGPVRYVSQPVRSPAIQEHLELIEKYQLLSKPLRETTGEDETEAIAQVRDALDSCAFPDLPETTAQALAEGLSLEGTGEALSIAASDLFLRADTSNPFDVHMNTGANVRRHLLRVNGVSQKNKILALLLWNSGPEIRPMLISSEPHLQPDAIAAIPRLSQQGLLDVIQDAIAANDVEGAMARAEKYEELDYDPQALIAMLGDIACQDNITEMHAIKHHQATFEEFHTTRPPFRFRHLVAAVKAAAISYGKAQEVYMEAKQLLNV